MARPKGKKNDPERRQLPFKQSEIERALRGAKARGFTVSRIDIEPRTGKISLIGAVSSMESVPQANPWDEVLVKKDDQDKKRAS